MASVASLGDLDHRLRADDLRDGVALAAEAIASGKAKESLEKMVAITNEGSA